MRLPLTGVSVTLAPPRPWHPFVVAALGFTLTFGALTGAIDLWHLRVSMQGVPVDHHRAHGFAQLFGFLGLFTMGMSLHLAPAFFGGAPPRGRALSVMTWGGIGGVLLLVFGRFGALLPGSPMVSVLGGWLLVLAMSTWASMLFRFWRALPESDAMQRFLVAGCGWWWLASLVTLGWTLGQSAGGPFASIPLEAVWAAALLGGTGSWLWGIFMRAGLCTLKVKRPPEAMQRRLFVAWQVACGSAFLAAFIDGLALLQHVSAAIAVGVLWWTVRPFSGSGLGAEGTLSPRAVQAGLCFVGVFGLLSLWRAASLFGVPAPLLLGDATRHALTLGGATLLVLGFAGRMVPGFAGTKMRHRGLYDAGLIALGSSALLRLTELFGTSRLALALSGASGGLAFLGVGLCAVALLHLPKPAWVR